MSAFKNVPRFKKKFKMKGEERDTAAALDALADKSAGIPCTYIEYNSATVLENIKLRFNAKENYLNIMRKEQKSVKNQGCCISKK